MRLENSLFKVTGYLHYNDCFKLYLFSFSELPECQLRIASHPNVLEQVICVSMSENCHCSTSVVVSEIFVCLAHCTATHQYLSRPGILEGLLQVYKNRCESADDKQLSAKDQRIVAALK